MLEAENADKLGTPFLYPSIFVSSPSGRNVHMELPVSRTNTLMILSIGEKSVVKRSQKKLLYHAISVMLPQINSSHADNAISVAAYVPIKSSVVVVFLW